MPFLENKMYFDFLIFNDSRFELSHLTTLSSSLLAVTIRSVGEFPCKSKLLSSANRFRVDIEVTLERSLI